jgi:hypothetical protein
MEIIYKKSARYKEELKSGLMREKYVEMYIKGREITFLLNALNKSFKTNLSVKDVQFADLDLLIWPPDEEGDPNSIHITLNDRYTSSESEAVVLKILEQMKENEHFVEVVRITCDCEVDSSRVEYFLRGLKDGDVFENILENVSRMCFIDWKTYQSNERIAQMIDEFEEILFAELVNKKIRVNGKSGVLKEVQGDCRYGFYERGVRKDYDCLSLVQKIGAKTIREIGF